MPSNDSKSTLSKSKKFGSIELDAMQIMGTQVLEPVIKDSAGSVVTVASTVTTEEEPRLFLGKSPLVSSLKKRNAKVPRLSRKSVIFSLESLPYALDYLQLLDHLLVIDETSESGHVLGLSAKTTWHMLDILGRREFVAIELKDGKRQYRPTVQSRLFLVHVFNQSGIVVLRISRTMTCELCWWGGDCCGSVLSVTDGEENLLGFVKQKTNIRTPTYEVYDTNNLVIFLIKSTTKCKFFCRRKHLEFDVYRIVVKNLRSKPDEVLCANMKKNYAGFATFTSADTFGINFAKDLEVWAKAMLIAALFLIDIQFFEVRNGKCTGCVLSSVILGIIFVALIVAAAVFYFLSA